MKLLGWRWLLLVPSLISASSAAPGTAADAPSRALRLTVEIVGLDPSRGTVRCALFASEETYLGDAARTTVLRVPEGRTSATWIVRDLPPGTYAFVLHHDVNDNGVNDRNFFGIPSEPYAFSRDARARFGPPKWQEVAFRLEARDLRLQAEIH